MSQLSKKLFFSFGLFCGRDLKIWIWGVPVVAAKSIFGCWGFFWKVCSVSGAPLTSVYSLFVKDSEIQLEWSGSSDSDSSFWCGFGYSPLDCFEVEFDRDEITIVV